MPWYRRWRNVFREDALSTELDAELAYHLAETADRLMEQGMPEAEALIAARRQLGNYTVQKERTRDMNLATWLDQLRADAMYGIRQLKQSPGFAAVAMLSLALGIGANTAIFQLVNAVRLKLLPVKDPEQLVVVDWNKDSVTLRIVDYEKREFHVYAMGCAARATEGIFRHDCLERVALRSDQRGRAALCTRGVCERQLLSSAGC